MSADWQNSQMKGNSTTGPNQPPGANSRHVGRWRSGGAGVAGAAQRFVGQKTYEHARQEEL